MSLKDFQILSRLGEGAYSSVYKVLRVEDQQIYALKRVKIQSLSAKEKENALNQVRILASVKHPNIVAYRQAFVDQASKSLCIVMEYASEGDLLKKITENSKKGINLPQSQIWSLFIQVTRGLAELHRLHIFHRDIKPANIFLHADGVVKLGDMNVSKITERGFCMTQTGTPYYASPQVWRDEPYDQKSDIWSLGCVVYQMITSKPPFRGEDMEGLFKKVTRGIYQRLPQQYSGDLSAVIRLLLQTNSQLRPSCQKILNLPQLIRRSKTKVFQIQQSQLLKTIKGQNLFALGDVLPKANYQGGKAKKGKVIRSLIDSLEQKQQKQLCQVQSLPTLDRDKKLSPGQKSDRIQSKQRALLPRDRKKSQIGSSRSGLQINGISNKLDQNKDIKLPKVQNRYQKVKDRLSKQTSMKCHKILQH